MPPTAAALVGPSQLFHVDPRHRRDHPLTPLQAVLTGLTNTAVLPPRFTPSRDDILRAEQLLVRMGMTGHEHTRWPTMSQGERGRVLTTRALMSSPRLLLVDEPATGLDIAGRDELWDALTTVAREQPALSTVLVTHHL
jgi:iron complex transport system ATP-binding protein